MSWAGFARLFKNVVAVVFQNAFQNISK